jgi:beta-barrel assembly-enhancing protease
VRLKKLIFPVILVAMSLILFQSIVFSGSFFDSLAVGLEKEIGYYNYQKIISEKHVIQLAPAETKRLNTVFYRLVNTCSRSRELQFSLTVVKDETVNAFALPGGYVFINSGLLSFIHNDSELAGVLGHEIAHVDRRHSMQAISRAVGMAFIINSILGGSSGHKEQISQLAQISMNLMQLGYSREAEFQADSYGVQFMRQAGYDRRDLLHFWRRMEKQVEEMPSVMTMFSTHPPTGERIRKIEKM